MINIKPIRIGGRLVGEGHRCYIIAEVGSNFDASLTKAKKLIQLAKKCGADAVKFQSFKTEELISKKGFQKKVAFQSRWKKSVWDVYKHAELPREWHKKLNQYSRKIGIHFFTSPWDFEAVDLLYKLKVPAFKIGSGDITYTEIIKYIGSKQKPVILSTGASSLEEVNNAIKAIKSTGNNKIILLHSVTQYPSPIENANVKALTTLREKFNLNVGYSDHSTGSLVVLASVALGACVIEKHFTDDPNLKGPDHPHSMNPKSFTNLVCRVRLLEKAMGNGVKKMENIERETRIIQRRSIWTIKPIIKGDKFNKNNIRAIRPALGISATKYGMILGKTSKKKYYAYQIIKEKDF